MLPLVVKSRVALAFVLSVLALCGCASRHLLTDTELAQADARNVRGDLRVYVSNRMITSYDRNATASTVIRREIRGRAVDDRFLRRLTPNAPGKIVGEDRSSGARRLWVSFDPRCSQPDCAYGFVGTEDGKYRLQVLPPREGYAAPTVYHRCTLNRHKMALGRLQSLSDANAVYRLKRKQPRTIFLEVKKDVRSRTRTSGTNDPGFD